MTASKMRFRRGLPMLAVLLVIAGLAGSWSPEVAADANDVGIRTNVTVDMTCFPPPPPEGEEPGIGPPPPCLLPDGLDPKFISPNPSGQARLIVKNDDTAKININLDGLAPDLVITAWLAYYFPPNPPADPNFDIFRPIDEGLPPLAGLSAPLAPTDAAFTEGLGHEPNEFVLHGQGRSVQGKLSIDLDYNPLKSGQGPLRNEPGLVTQVAAPASSGAEQPLCCPDGFPAPRPQPIGGSYLRQFDQTTGLPVLGPDGRPQLLRSPVPVAVIALVVHIDETTHGLSAGIPIPPIPGIPATAGDHYTLGLFDLRQFHQE